MVSASCAAWDWKPDSARPVPVGLDAAEYLVRAQQGMDLSVRAETVEGDAHRAAGGAWAGWETMRKPRMFENEAPAEAVGTLSAFEDLNEEPHGRSLSNADGQAFVAQGQLDRVEDVNLVRPWYRLVVDGEMRYVYSHRLYPRIES